MTLQEFKKQINSSLTNIPTGSFTQALSGSLHYFSEVVDVHLNERDEWVMTNPETQEIVSWDANIDKAWAKFLKA